MPKNRDYTGLERTPSSMAWLIGTRARLLGRLERYRKQFDTLPQLMQQLEAEIASLDAVIPLHTVKVEPTSIAAVRPQRAPSAGYGKLKNSLVRSLKEAGGAPLTTVELVMQFVRRHSIDTSKYPQSALMDSARKRLCELTKNGLVRRLHPIATRQYGIWSWIGRDDEQ